MNHFPRLRIIFPTEELFDEYGPCENLLRLAGTSVKDVIAYVVDYWLHRLEPWEPDMTGDPLRVLFSFMDTDFLYDQRYHTTIAVEDIATVRHILHRIGTSVYLSVMPILDSHRLPDFVQQQVRMEGWLGTSLVLSTVSSQFRHGLP